MPKGGRAQWLAWAVLALPALYLLRVHAQIVSFPLAHLGTEGTEASFARCLALGQDPSSAQWAPTCGSAYGFVHGGLAAFLGGARAADSLILQRLLAALGLFAALGILVAWTLSHGQTRFRAAALAVSVYAGWLFSSTPHARPDGLAVFLFIGSFCAGTWPNGGKPAAVLTGLLAALGYFTKPYAVLGLPLAALANAVDGRWLRAKQAALSGMLFGVLGAWWAWAHFQNYFLVTLFLQGQHARFDGAHLASQAGSLLQQHAGLLGAAIIGLLHRRRSRLSGLGAATAALGALLLFMSGHDGAYLTYFEQLGLPVLGALILFSLPAQGRGQRLGALLLVCNAYSASFFLGHYQLQSADYYAGVVADYEGAVAPLKPQQALLAAELQPLARRYDQAMPDNDTLRFFVDVKGPACCAACQAAASAISAASRAHVLAEQSKIAAGAYAFIALPVYSPILQGADLRHYTPASAVYGAPGSPLPAFLTILQRTEVPHAAR